MNDPRQDEHKDGAAIPSDSAAESRDVPLHEAEPVDVTPSEPEPAATRSDPGFAEPTATRSDPGFEPAPPGPASAGRSFGVVLGLFALLVAFAAAGGVAFTWWKVAEQQEAVVGQNAESARTLAAIRELVATTQERVAVQEERLGSFSSDAQQRRERLDGLDAELRQARARLEALAQEDLGPERSPSIAEIEFLLLLAGRELALADNPKVALAALREADQRVARLNDPGLSAVRGAINDEIAAVEAVASIDRDGLAMRLGSLARRVEGLPLRGSLAPDLLHEAAADEDASGWDRVVGRMRDVGANLFRIRRTDTPAAPLLAPDESFFLYRNVELDLKSARLAVLARDADNYAASLEAARNALREYFETGDEAVKALIAAIEELESHDIAPQWPDIKRSVDQLRSAGGAR